MIEKHVDEVNRSLAAEPRMGGAQIRRFLILHKELDADDGELTRTQKVRRGFIGERYAPLIAALYDGSQEADIATEVTFEDGRKGTIAARVKIRDMAAHPGAGRGRAGAGGGGMRAPDSPILAKGDVLLAVEDVSLGFGGVKALTEVSFDIRKGEIRAIIGPNGAGKTSMLNCINGFYHPTEGASPSRAGRGRRCGPPRPLAAASRARSRTSRCSRACRPSTTSWPGRSLKMHASFFWQLLRHGPALREEVEHRRVVEDIIDFLEIQHDPQGAGRQAALRSAEAGRARPGARDGAGAPAPRRADGGHEPRGEGGHVPLHPRREPAVRHDDRADRARHGRGDGPVGPGRRARIRPQDRRRRARKRSSATSASSTPISAWRTEGGDGPPLQDLRRAFRADGRRAGPPRPDALGGARLRRPLCADRARLRADLQGVGRVQLRAGHHGRVRRPDPRRAAREGRAGAPRARARHRRHVRARGRGRARRAAPARQPARHHPVHGDVRADLFPDRPRRADLRRQSEADDREPSCTCRRARPTSCSSAARCASSTSTSPPR